MSENTCIVSKSFIFIPTDNIPDAVGPRKKNVQDGESSGGLGGRGGRKGRKGSKRKKTEREGDLSSYGGNKMRKGGKGNRKKGKISGCIQITV